jgi:dinuclear metal center YbgI/SA1388 family protein
MLVADIIRVLEQIAPPALQESYDNAGLITGRRDMEVRGVLVCLDSTEAIIREAALRGCNMVVAHHPIIFKGLKRLTGSTYAERAVELAIREGIAIYAIHTNLDNVLYRGVNQRIGARLGLQDLRILAPMREQLFKLETFVPHAHADVVREALFAAGGGTIGNYDACSFNLSGTGTFRPGAGSNPFVGTAGVIHREEETYIQMIAPRHREAALIQALKAAHPYEEVAYQVLPLLNEWQESGSGLIGQLPEAMESEAFLKHVQQAMELPGIRLAIGPQKHIKRVALCGGAGSFLTKKALQAGADAYITADVKYHEFFDQEEQMWLLDIGHFESEQYTINLIVEVLNENFPKFAVLSQDTNTNPVKYFPKPWI